MNVELQVWWMPQVPGKAFEYAVGTIETAETLTDALARYDLFQLHNNIKPDYCNAGGIQWRHPEGTDGKWWDLDPDCCEELDEFMKYSESREDSLHVCE